MNNNSIELRIVHFYIPLIVHLYFTLYKESESAKIEKSTIFICETKTKCDKIEYNTVEIKGQL